MLPGTPGTGLKENPYLVDYNIANRDRNVGNIYIDVTTPVSGLTLTPTAGYKWDQFPSDPILRAQNKYQLGLQNDKSWNTGLEANYLINSNIGLMASYTRENLSQKLLGTSASGYSNGVLSNSLVEGTLYTSKMGEIVNTLVAGIDYQIIPESLSLKLSATHMWANDTWITGAMPGCLANNAAGTSCGIVSAGNPAYTPEKTTFDRFDANIKYKLGNEYLSFLMVKEAFLQVHYAYELNHVKNWQTDGAAPYMYSTLNSSTTGFKDMIFMAGNNPNYHAQVVMGSVVLKW